MMSLKTKTFILAVPLLITACGSSALELSTAEASPNRNSVEPSSSPEPVKRTDPATEPSIDPSLINRRVDDDEIYVFPGLIPRDGIRPIYEPVFGSAESALLLEDELVIGFAHEGEAKAYPISVLRFREMVNDELAGLPFLVTW
jgi:hypothetical protein